MRRLILLLTVLSMIFACFATVNADSDSEAPLSYESIPGVTAEEIEAIEALKSTRKSFSYGHLNTTEAFLLPDGTYAGFTIYFCELLSELFGVPFIPTSVGWENISAIVEEKEIDFYGDNVPSIQNDPDYYKTDSISRSAIGVFTLENSPNIINEYRLNGMNVGFMEYSGLPSSIRSAYPGIAFNTVTIEDYADAVEKLQSGEVDAFITTSVMKPILDAYGFVGTETMFPLIKPSCSMLTADAEFLPIISVVNKYLAAGGIDTLYSLYEKGDEEYKIYELNRSFTDEERAFIAGLAERGEKIPVAFENENYPISFYNKTEREFQGIAPDILKEISRITGIEFEVKSPPDASWTNIMKSLENGEISIVSELLYTEKRKDSFLWGTAPYATAHYALLSKADYPFLTTHKIERVKVGTLKEAAFDDKYHEWFPLNDNTVTYATAEEAISALDAKEIDVFMASEYTLLMQANYLGQTDYKVNLLFDEPLESYFGFYRGAPVLRSIVSKAQSYVDTEMIEYTWTNRVFDYAAQYAARLARMSLIFAIFLSCALALTVFLFFKNERLNHNLENLVKQRTSELEQQTARLVRMSLIADNAPLYIAYVNKKGEFGYLNPATCEITGYTAEELSENGLEMLYDKETNRRIREEIIPGIFEKGNYEFEIPLIRKDGERRIMAFSAFTIPADDFGCGTIAMDITERKRLEKELIEAKELAIRNSLSKSTFLSRMSHEIRTPLNAIIGMTRIAKRAGTMERINDCHEKIDSASTHLLGVINDVLDMSKIEAGKFELNQEAFSIEKMVTKIANVFQLRFEEKRISFSISVDESIPPILSDEQRLTQVIANLIGNAVKFTPEHGGISLDISKLSEQNSYCTLEFKIKDTGIGISKDFLDKVFLSYEQEKGIGVGNHGGTGLGLPISKQIVEMMDGNMWVESEPGKGSEFTFTICAKVSDTPLDIETEVGEADDSSIDFQGKRILLAEDVEVNREIVLAMLEDTGIIIDCAENGSEALRLFKENPDYDLIFMDILMPVMNGHEATRAIRSLSVQNAASVPIIAMSANVFKEDVEACMDAGMNGHVGKPLDFDAVMEMLKKYLTRNP